MYGRHSESLTFVRVLYSNQMFFYMFAIGLKMRMTSIKSNYPIIVSIKMPL